MHRLYTIFIIILLTPAVVIGSCIHKYIRCKRMYAPGHYRAWIFLHDYNINRLIIPI